MESKTIRRTTGVVLVAVSRLVAAVSVCSVCQRWFEIVTGCTTSSWLTVMEKAMGLVKDHDRHSLCVCEWKRGRNESICHNVKNLTTSRIMMMCTHTSREAEIRLILADHLDVSHKEEHHIVQW